MLVITGAFVERTCEARAMAGRSIVLDFDGAVDGDVRPVDTVIGDSVETDAGKKGGMVTAELDVKEPATGAAAVLIEVADGAGGGRRSRCIPLCGHITDDLLRLSWSSRNCIFCCYGRHRSSGSGN